MDRLKQAATNNKVRPSKIDQDLNFIVSEVSRQDSAAEIGSITLRLGWRPEGMTSPDYLLTLADQATELLGELGITGWLPDLESSREASQGPNLNGYGNQGVKVWRRDQHSLVLSRAVELAKVVPLQLAEPVPPLAA